MTELKPRTLCIIIAGCPENIGLVVEVIKRIGPTYGYKDAYKIKTVTGKNFAQLWTASNTLVRGSSSECITERHKLRPLVEDASSDEQGQEVSINKGWAVKKVISTTV